jgi:hypothetical protein
MYYITGPGSGSANVEGVDPDHFEDAAIREMAEKYQKKGMVLTDAQEDAEGYGIGTGVGAFVFTKGFNAVDDTEGDNEFFISVVKATPDEFKSFVKNYKYKLKEKKQKSDITSLTYHDSMNQIDVTYNNKTFDDCNFTYGDHEIRVEFVDRNNTSIKQFVRSDQGNFLNLYLE